MLCFQELDVFLGVNCRNSFRSLIVLRGSLRTIALNYFWPKIFGFAYIRSLDGCKSETLVFSFCLVDIPLDIVDIALYARLHDILKHLPVPILSADIES
jgi:hypothetical protein